MEKPRLSTNSASSSKLRTRFAFFKTSCGVKATLAGDWKERYVGVCFGSSWCGDGVWSKNEFCRSPSLVGVDTCIQLSPLTGERKAIVAAALGVFLSSGSSLILQP